MPNDVFTSLLMGSLTYMLNVYKSLIRVIGRKLQEKRDVDVFLCVTKIIASIHIYF